jgi:uncharacterized protein YdeI (YjbR/CyaY-like superfamily)
VTSKKPTLKAPASTTSKKPASDYPNVNVETRAELRDWLRKNHTKASGVWLVTKKKSAGGAIAWNDIVEECLCVGWVDSLPRKLDDERTMILVAPRKPKSNWSAKNKEHVRRLQAEGLMLPSGLFAVELAKKNGGWTALDAVCALTVPTDLEDAFRRYPCAKAYWDAFPPSSRRGILEWIANAKKPETRSARVAQTAALAAKNERANQWRG